MCYQAGELEESLFQGCLHMPMEEFDSGSSKCSIDDLEHANNPNLWICGASKSSVQTNGTKWCRDVLTVDYMPCTFPKPLMEPVEWMHCLATLDTTVLRLGPNFVDDNGYDVHPFYMIDAIEPPRNELHV